jgi:hypothetical protein
MEVMRGNALFTVRNALFTVRNALFTVRNALFTVRNALFTVRNALFERVSVGLFRYSALYPGHGRRALLPPGHVCMQWMQRGSRGCSPGVG